MNAADLASALGAKRSGRQFVCRCPAHNDSDPSLIFWDGDKAIRFKCYAGCDPRDVLDELRRCGLLDDEKPPRAASTRKPPPIAADEERVRIHNLKLARRIWNEAVPIEGTPGEQQYFRKPKSEDGRGIDIAQAPDFGGLRWHPRCLWGSGTTACVIGRYTDAITGEPRGIWRRPINGERPRALGAMAGCVIRLWPDDAVTSGLVLGEGVESTLAAALRIRHRGTLLRPAWAAGCADNMANLPVLAGISVLTLLVDNDKNGRGQEAAAECARRWTDAGREVVRLTPTETGVDFNDIVNGEMP